MNTIANRARAEVNTEADSEGSVTKAVKCGVCGLHMTDAAFDRHSCNQSYTTYDGLRHQQSEARRLK